MKSDLAKVLHPMAGLPLLAHVLATLERLGVGRVLVVIGHQRDRVTFRPHWFGGDSAGSDDGAPMRNRSHHAAILEDAEAVITRLAKLGGRTFGTSVGRP
jgi:hypothetical protein